MEEGAATPESSTKARKPRGPNKQLMKVVFYEDGKPPETDYYYAHVECSQAA